MEKRGIDTRQQCRLQWAAERGAITWGEAKTLEDFYWRVIAARQRIANERGWQVS